MGWFKQAQERQEDKVVSKIKNILQSHPFFQQLMIDYQIPPEDINNHLRIVFADLENKFAEGNGEEIKISKKLLNDAFFKRNFHFVVHEFFHWIKRRSEALFYFNDDEEIQSFSLAIAWEILSGNANTVEETFYPIIAGHFENRADARQMFDSILSEAKKLVDTYKENQSNAQGIQL